MKKFQLILLLTILLIIIIGAAVFVFFSGSYNLEPMELADPTNDVLITVGSNVPKAVDITGASLVVTQDQANFTIRTDAQNIGSIDKGNITWQVIMVFENSTNAIDTYYLQATLNSSGISCTIKNVSEATEKNIDINTQKTNLFISMPLIGLPQFEQVSWSITSIYEEESQGKIVANAFDFAPDQGIHVTTVQPQTITQ